MARRQTNGLFLMTPYALLRLPEYGRFFDGASVGYLYRLILTGVRRQGLRDLKFQNKTGWVTKLAEHYDDGKLASYFTMEDLVESTGFTDRRLTDLIKTLERIKLVKTEPFNKGIIFIVGARLIQTNIDGYTVGGEHEGLFIDSWETAARNEPRKLASFLIDELAPPKQKEKFQRKIFRDSTKNISETGPSEISEEARPGQDISEPEETPSVDRVSVDEIKAASPRESTDLLDWAKEEPGDYEARQAKSRILSEPDWREKFKAARAAIALDITLAEVNALLARTLPEEFSSFSSFPRLGYTLYSMKYSDKESRKHSHVKLSTLWRALHEDVTGVSVGDASDKFRDMRGFYKNTLLKKYSFNQVLWTIRNHVLTNRSTTEFVASGHRNLLTVVEQAARRYQKLQENEDKQVQNDKVQEERLKRLDDVRKVTGEEKSDNPWAKLYLNKEKNEQ